MQIEKDEQKRTSRYRAALERVKWEQMAILTLLLSPLSPHNHNFKKYLLLWTHCPGSAICQKLEEADNAPSERSIFHVSLS